LKPLRRIKKMRNQISVLAVFAVAVIAFGLVTKQTNANKPVFISGTQDELNNAEQISLGILRDRAAQRAIGNVDEFKVQKVEVDDLKMAHTRVRQIVGGVPVWEGEAIVHLNADGSLSTITDDLKESIAVNTETNLSKEDAIGAARRMYKGSKNLTEEPTADLWIFRAADRDHLTYRVQMRREDGSKDTAMPVIFVDAQTGEKVFGYDNLQTGTGPTLYSGTVTIGTSSLSGTYYMENLTRKVGTFNYNNGTTTAARFTDANDIWDTAAQKAGVDAQYGAEATMNYYQNVHARNGIDGNGGPGTTTAAANSAISLIASRVHYSSNYNNAFWNGSYMTYGDGDGTTFTPLVTVDICGHEMTHGVTERTANLTYSNESGALNEAVSDIFGAMVERNRRGVTDANTWKIGEQAYTPNTAGDALRYMNNPTQGNQPDYYPNRLITTSDNGGVHTNSGIANYAFYLMAQGGTTSRGAVVTGIGATDAEKIWYRALTVYMTASTNFAGARTATINAASSLFGSASTQAASVASAWCAVGVGTCTSPTPTPTGTNLLVNGGFESVITPWVMSGTGALYVANGTSPRTGTGYVYFGAANSVTGQTYQTVAIPTTATGTLTFWLNVTSAETTTTTQYDKLNVEVRNTAGTLLATAATYSNLNKGTAGVYAQKSLNLAAYKGQTVRVQFSMSNDSSAITTFRVDDADLR
jgi:Zn-dependent metalloprotease